ncbi:MAG: PIN domain-containing protein [bacterium]
MVTKEQQIEIYQEELKEVEFQIKRTFNSRAYTLFQNGEMYVGVYKGYSQLNGAIFVQIPNGSKYHTPRLDIKLNCFTLPLGKEKPSMWNDLRYIDLIENRNSCEIKIVNYAKCDREGWITMVLQGVEMEFMENLQTNQILAFGPVTPPYEYLYNLKRFSESISSENNIWNNILQFNLATTNNRNPILLREDIDIVSSIINDVEKCNLYTLQGPPGTGKTYIVADLVSRLINEGKSVLITSLTNKSLIEVCMKPFFDNIFEKELISKTNLTLEERLSFPKIKAVKDEIIAIDGAVTLATYYQFSKIWDKQTHTFDYVIVEEASQAFLTTIAAALKIGKKVIVVGDPLQITPIIQNKNINEITDSNTLINGMQTICSITQFNYGRKIETRRLTYRSTEYTNLFYQNTIESKSIYSDLTTDIQQFSYISNAIHPKGGPTLIKLPYQEGHNNALEFIIKIIDDLSILKNVKIAVLTPQIETLKILQQNLKQRTQKTDYIVETVDRVQGLDVDYCIYYMPKVSRFSLNDNRFNVATSRAKKSTFIVIPEKYQHLLLNNNASKYINKLDAEYSFNLTNELKLEKCTCTANPEVFVKTPLEDIFENSTKKEEENTGIKVVGKIDLSQFKTPKQREIISSSKKNIYIIDTNVFVNQPDIISKIDNKYDIVLSAKVIDELDHLKIKLGNNDKKNVDLALRNINKQIDKSNIKMEFSDSTLLPNDFDKRSPDNNILTVALKYINENPILLTSDNGLQIKAKGLKIATISLKEFLKR